MTDDATKCAVLGCDAEQHTIQGISFPGLGFLRLCIEHIIALKAACPINEIDINIQE